MTQYKGEQYFINRELSLLKFNERVLEQAVDLDNPILERLKFLCIVSSNMDEFFEVRVAAIKEQIHYGASFTGPERLVPRQAFEYISREAHALVDRQYRIFNENIVPELNSNGIRFLRRSEWSAAESEWIEEFFRKEVYPVLTPMGLDPAHPFPRILNKSLNFAVELSGRDGFGRSCDHAVVQAPRVLPRVIKLPSSVANGENDFVFLSSVLHAHVGQLFSGMEVRGCYQFRVTRNSDLFFDDEEVVNLRNALQGELPRRNFGDAVRLEVADNCSEDMADFLLGQVGLSREDLYRVQGPVNLVRLMRVPDGIERPELKFSPFIPGIPAELGKGEDIFSVIKKKDILLHHPYQSFQPVVDFLEKAAVDPSVLCIKQTVYRTSSDSALMGALIKAAQAGKEVTVVVELLARFDEEANINWSKKLEDSGAHVVYGVFGYKTHAKLALVVRREENGIRRYAHLGTGNYHPKTARLYTDFGLLTSNQDICDDVNDVFLQITSLGKSGGLKHLLQAPFSLHSSIIEKIQREIDNVNLGKKAYIKARMNSLLEEELIDKLYEASQAGVKIDLIVRGVCALRPGIPGVSDNIRVRSVVGRFLEHARVFYFYGDGLEEVYLSSADWMVRNFFRRIEVAFPILDPVLKRRVVREGLTYYLQDNRQSWEMKADGTFVRRVTRGRPCRAQGKLLALHARGSK